jgi:hypothetical protein
VLTTARLDAEPIRFGGQAKLESITARPTSRPRPFSNGSKPECRWNSRRDPHATVRLLDVVVPPLVFGALYRARRDRAAPSGVDLPGRVEGHRVLASDVPRKATRPARKPASRFGSPRRSRLVGHGRACASTTVKTVLRHRRRRGEEGYRRVSHNSDEAGNPREHRAPRRRQRRQGATDSSKEQGPEVKVSETANREASPITGERIKGNTTGSNGARASTTVTWHGFRRGESFEG